VYFFDCAYNVDVGYADSLAECVRITLDGTMFSGGTRGLRRGAVPDEVHLRLYEENNPIYDYEETGIKRPALSGRAVYFSASGEAAEGVHEGAHELRDLQFLRRRSWSGASLGGDME
jgi:hypothetical protein